MNEKKGSPDMATMQEVAARLGVETRIVRAFVRRHEIPREKTLGQRERHVSIPTYAAKLRSAGYVKEAQSLEQWLAERQAEHGKSA